MRWTLLPGIYIDAKGHDGLTPSDALLAGLASCVGVYIRKYAEGAKLILENFTVAAEAQFSQTPSYCFKSIDIKIDLLGVKLDERREKALMDFIRNCPRS